MINLPEGHFPVIHPSLRPLYDQLRAVWVQRVFWAGQSIREQVKSGPDHSSLGQNLAREAAELAYIEGEISALISANIALGEED